MMLTHLCHIDVTSWLFVARALAVQIQKWETQLLHYSRTEAYLVCLAFSEWSACSPLFLSQFGISSLGFDVSYDVHQEDFPHLQ